MSSLSKREIILLILLFIAIIGAIYYNVVLKPYFNNDVALDAQITDVNTSINDARQKAAVIEIINGKIKDIRTDMDQKFTNVLDSIDNPAIIVLLNKTVYPEAADPTFTFSPAYTDLGNNYITTVVAAFQCKKDDFGKILAKLRSTMPISRVTNASIQVVDEATKNCEATISINILTSSLVPTNTEFNYK